MGMGHSIVHIAPCSHDDYGYEHDDFDYDVGDYEGALDKALAAANYTELRAEQARRRARCGAATNSPPSVPPKASRRR